MPLLEPGLTFLDTGENPHLWIILTSPTDNQKALVVSVNITDAHNICDDSCDLFIGDHPYINKDTRVYYREARLGSSSGILEAVKQSILIPKDPLSPEILEKVLQGALKSKHLDRNLKRIILESIEDQT